MTVKKAPSQKEVSPRFDLTKRPIGSVFVGITIDQFALPDGAQKTNEHLHEKTMSLDFDEERLEMRGNGTTFNLKNGGEYISSRAPAQLKINFKEKKGSVNFDTIQFISLAVMKKRTGDLFKDQHTVDITVGEFNKKSKSFSCSLYFNLEPKLWHYVYDRALNENFEFVFQILFDQRILNIMNLGYIHFNEQRVSFDEDFEIMVENGILTAATRLISISRIK